MQIPGSVNNLPNLTKANEMAEEESLAGKLDLERLFPILNKSLGWIILFIIFSAGAGYLYLRSTRPIYESNSILKLDIKSKASKVLGERIGFDEEVSTQNSLQGEIELIKSSVIYNEVIQRLPLDISYYQFGKFLYTELYEGCPFAVRYKIINDRIYDVEVDLEFISATEYTLRYRAGGESVSNKFKLSQVYKNKDIELQVNPTRFFSPQLVGQKFFFTINSRGNLLKMMENNLKASILNASANTISISFSDFSPAKARNIVNTVDTVYKEKTLEKKMQSNDQTLKFIKSQLDSTQKLLEKSEMQLQDFIFRTRTVDPKATLLTATTEVGLLMKSRISLVQHITQLKEIKSEVVDEKAIGKYIPILGTITEIEINRLITALNTLADNQTSISKRIKKETTAAGGLSAKRYKDSKENAIVLLEANIKDLNHQLEIMNAEIGKIESQFQNLPSQETEINRIKRFLALNEEFYLLLKKKEAEFGIAKAGTVPDFQILMPANVPTIPISPQKGTVYTLWIIIGIIAGIVLVFVRYVLQDTVSTVRELEKNTVAPLLGVVPVYTKEKLRVAKMVVDKNPKSSLSEALRAIRTNIEFVSSQEGTGKKRIISVTSTVAGEGKTFVAINLSGILAMSTQKVVLLDLDMRKPKLHLAFDVTNDKGMSSILSDKTTWQEAVLHTPQQDIDVIPAGPPPPNPAELLMRPAFDQLLRDLHEVYDVIVIDSPPVGLVTDGIIIMQKADLPIYVVRSEYSKRVYLKNINKLVKANGFRSLGVVMNGLDKLKTYGYGYGYGYDYYTDDDVPQGFDANWFKTLLGIKN